MKHWKHELSRDVLALGSWVFYVLVLVRALIGPFRPFVDQLVIAGIVLIALRFIVREQEEYVARGIVLAVFTSVFYQDILFTVFAMLIVLSMIVSAYVFEKNTKKILLGLFVGVFSALVGWYSS